MGLERVTERQRDGEGVEDTNADEVEVEQLPTIFDSSSDACGDKRRDEATESVHGMYEAQQAMRTVDGSNECVSV